MQVVTKKVFLSQLSTPMHSTLQFPTGNEVRGDVIKVYIKTIKALRLVDPRGLLLEGVSKSQFFDPMMSGCVGFFSADLRPRSTPIREYLKKRKDTVRCIITASKSHSEGWVCSRLPKLQEVEGIYAGT